MYVELREGGTILVTLEALRVEVWMIQSKLAHDMCDWCR